MSAEVHASKIYSVWIGSSVTQRKLILTHYTEPGNLEEDSIIFAYNSRVKK